MGTGKASLEEGRGGELEEPAPSGPGVKAADGEHLDLEEGLRGGGERQPAWRAVGEGALVGAWFHRVRLLHHQGDGGKALGLVEAVVQA